MEIWGEGGGCWEEKQLGWGSQERAFQATADWPWPKGSQPTRRYLSPPLEHSWASGTHQLVAQGSRPCWKEKRYLGIHPSHPPRKEAEILSWGTEGPPVLGSTPSFPASASSLASGFPGS